jgi:hypothetical protein
MKLKIINSCMEYEQPIEIIQKPVGRSGQFKKFVKFLNNGEEVSLSSLKNSLKDKMQIID